MGSWTLISGAVSRSLADWEFSQTVRKLKPFECDTVTLRAPGKLIDANPLLAQWATVSLNDPNGHPWFAGIVTKIPLRGSVKAEMQEYEISGPWWYFDNLVFQVAWQGYNGTSSELVSTLRTTVIVGQDNSYNFIDLGGFARLVMEYVLAAAASVPAFVPFQIGTIGVDTAVPQFDIADRTCAKIMIDLMQWVPDAVMSFDYTTTPPTLNILRRGAAPQVNLPAFGKPTNAIDLTPRADLVVPGGDREIYHDQLD